MKKVVAFIGSPRKNGNVSTLVQEIVRGAKEAGGMTKIYTLYDMNIKPCLGCFSCQNAGICIINDDDMQSVYKDIQEADGIIIGSPVYMCQVTAQTKLLLDRLFATIGRNGNEYKPRFGVKNAVVVYSYGAADSGNFIQSFKVNANLFKILGLNIIDTIEASGANDIKIASSNKELLSRAYNAGSGLIQ